MRFSVLMMLAETSPCGSPAEPERPRIGVSERRVQGEPMKRMRAMAIRATMSGAPASAGVAKVMRSCFTSRSVGEPMVSVASRSGMR